MALRSYFPELNRRRVTDASIHTFVPSAFCTDWLPLALSSRRPPVQLRPVQPPPVRPFRQLFCELFQHMIVRAFDLVVRGLTHRLQDSHHGAHQLVDVSVRDDACHLFVSGYVGCYADAQRDVTPQPSEPGHCPPEGVRCRTNTRSRRWLGTDSTATLRPLGCSRLPDVRTPTESNGTRHQDRLGAHPPYTCSRGCVDAMRLSTTSHRTSDICTSDSTCVYPGCRNNGVPCRLR